MTSVFDWWPIGVRKSRGGAERHRHQEGIGVVAELVGETAAIGAITSTVAALFRNGVTAMPATRISASAPMRGSAAPPHDSQAAMRSVAAGRLHRLADRDQRRRSGQERPLDHLVGLAQAERARRISTSAARKKAKATGTSWKRRAPSPTASTRIGT